MSTEIRKQLPSNYRPSSILKFSKLLFFFILSMMFINNSLFSQDKKEKNTIKKIYKNPTLEEQILASQKELVNLLKEYYVKTKDYPKKQIFKTIATDEKILNGKNTKSFIDKIRKKEPNTIVLVFGRGSKKKIGSRNVYVFKEQAEIVSNKGKIGALSFIYIQSDHDSLYTEGRIIKNPNIQSGTLDNLEISSYTSMLKHKKYILKEILSSKVKNRILYNYRGYLNKMNRIVKYVLFLIEKEEEVDINRIMNIGNF